MSVNSFHRRLETLEAAHGQSGRRDGGLDPIRRMLLLLVAHHIGGMGPDESVAVGLTRALEYRAPHDLKRELHGKADTAGNLDFDERYQDAVRRLLALRGASFADTGNVVAQALRGLFYAMPEAMQRHHYVADLELQRLFADMPDEPVSTSMFACGVEPDGTCNRHEAVAAHLRQASCFQPVEVSDGTTVGQAAADDEDALRRC